MSTIKIDKLGAIGVVKDTSSPELPINAWTDALNIRFLDGSVWQAPGYGEVISSPSVIPYFVMPVRVSTADHWLYAGTQKIYTAWMSGSTPTHTNLTRQTMGADVNYSATANSWTGTVLGGIPILNPGNTTDPPQMWDLNVANRCVALTNWPASTYCRSLRAFKNFLVALNVTASSVNYPYLVQWSHPADPGSVPSSWDTTDTTKDAGKFDIAEGYDHIVDGMQLGDGFIIFKESSIWRMDYTGGVGVMGLRKVLGTSGALNRNCIIEHNGILFVLTGEDVIAHDGAQAVSVLDRQSRRELFNTIDDTYKETAFVFKNPFFNELIVAYASAGAVCPDRAMVWNLNDKTVSFRSLPAVRHAACGALDVSYTDTWANDSQPWATDLSSWNSPAPVPRTSRVMMGTNGQNLYMLDLGADYSGSIASAYVERRGLHFGEPNRIKLVKAIRPRIYGNTGSTVVISVAGTNDPWEEPVYSSQSHIIGTTINNYFIVSGRYISIKFSTGTAYTWRLDSLDIDLEIMGEI